MPQPRRPIPGSRKRATAQDLRELNAVFKDSPDHGKAKVTHTELRATRQKGGTKHVDGTDGFGQMLRGLGQRGEAAAFAIKTQLSLGEEDSDSDAEKRADEEEYESDPGWESDEDDSQQQLAAEEPVHAVPEKTTQLKIGTWKQAGFGSTPAEIAALEEAIKPRRSTLTPEGEMTGFAALVKASLYKTPNKKPVDANALVEPKLKMNFRRLSSFSAAKSADEERAKGELLRNLPARAVFVPPDHSLSTVVKLYAHLLRVNLNPEQYDENREGADHDRDQLPEGLTLWHINPLVDKRLGHAGRRYALERYLITTDESWQHALRQAVSGEIAWLESVMDLSAVQLQSGNVQCQHTGTHTLWEVAAMPAHQRPAFSEQTVEKLLTMELQPNVRRMEQIRTLGNKVSGASRVKALHGEVLMQVATVEFAAATLWWVASAAWDLSGDPEQRAVRDLTVLKRMIGWMQQVYTGGDALGAERGRTGRRAMLQHMCVGAIAAIMLNNSSASAIVDTLHAPLPVDPDAKPDTRAPTTGWQMLGVVTAQLARSRASDVQDERPAATMFEKLVYYKHGLVMNDAVLMEPIAGVPNADADTNPTASSPVKSRPSTANADGASKEAAAKEHAQILEATASAMRHEAISGAVTATFCVGMRHWGADAVKFVDAAGGCNWLLKLLHSSTEAWQHAGAALVELYASTSYGRSRLALRVEELSSVVHVLCALLGQPCRMRYHSERRGRKGLQPSLPFTLHHACAAALWRCADAVMEVDGIALDTELVRPLLLLPASSDDKPRPTPAALSGAAAALVRLATLPRTAMLLAKQDTLLPAALNGLMAAPTDDEDVTPHPHVRTSAVVVMGLLGRHAAGAWDPAAAAATVAAADAALLRMRPEFVQTLSQLNVRPESHIVKPAKPIAASTVLPPRKGSSKSPERLGRTLGREEPGNDRGDRSPNSERSLPSFTAPESEHSDDGDSQDSASIGEPEDALDDTPLTPLPVTPMTTMRQTSSVTPHRATSVTPGRAAADTPRGAKQAGDAGDGEAGEPVHEAAGAALFVLSLAPAKAVHAAKRETANANNHERASAAARVPSGLVVTAGEVAAMGGLIRSAPAGSRGLTLASATAWRMICEGGDPAAGLTVPIIGGPDFARWLAKAALRCWAKIPDEQLKYANLTAANASSPPPKSPGGFDTRWVLATPALKARAQAKRRAENIEQMELQATLSFALGALGAMVYRSDGIVAVFGTGKQRRHMILYAEKLKRGPTGEWAAENLAYLLSKASHTGVTMPLVVATLHTVALRCPFHRRTLANLGVGVVVEGVLADTSVPVGLRVMCAELALALLDLLPHAPPPVAYGEPNEHTKLPGASKGAAPDPLRDVFLWPLPFAPPEDESGTLPLEQRVRLDDACATRRARRAVQLAVELMQAPEHELKQVGVRAVAILATRESVSKRLAAWGVAPPLNALLREEGWEQNPRVAMSVTLATLALYNMSYLAPNQPVIGQMCLPALLQVCQRCEGLPEASATQPPLTRTLVVSAHRCAVASLQNIMRHPSNRTELYKAELALRRVQLQDQLKPPVPASLLRLSTAPAKLTAPANAGIFPGGALAEWGDMFAQQLPTGGNPQSDCAHPSRGVSRHSSRPGTCEGLVPSLPLHRLRLAIPGDTGGDVDSPSSRVGMPANPRSARNPAACTPRRMHSTPPTARPNTVGAKPTVRASIGSFTERPIRTAGASPLSEANGSMTQRSGTVVTPRRALSHRLRRPIRTLWNASTGTFIEPTPDQAAKWLAETTLNTPEKGGQRTPSSPSRTVRKYTERGDGGIVHESTMEARWKRADPTKRRFQMVSGLSSAVDPADVHWTADHMVGARGSLVEQTLGLTAWMSGWHDQAGQEAIAKRENALSQALQLNPERSELEGELSLRQAAPPSDLSHRLASPHGTMQPLLSAQAFQVAYTSRYRAGAATTDRNRFGDTPRSHVHLTPRPPRTTAYKNSRPQPKSVRKKKAVPQMAETAAQRNHSPVVKPEANRGSAAAPGMTADTLVYRHTEGCEVCRGLYRHYKLSDGSCVHVAMQPESNTTALPSIVSWQPLPAPLELEHVFQEAWPSTSFLDALVRPPTDWVEHWDASMHPAFPGGPPVKDPNVVLTPPPLQLVMEYSSSEADIVAHKQTVDTEFLWLWKSILQTRGRYDSESKDFFDRKAIELAAVNKDWDRLTKQRTFTELLGAEASAVQTVVDLHFPLIRHVYEYYSVVGGPGGGQAAEFQMDVDEWQLFLMESGVIEDQPALFTEVNGSESTRFNSDSVFLRSEFVHALIELASRKFVREGLSESLAESLHYLIEKHVKPNPRTAWDMDINSFRRERLYTRPVVAFFEDNKPLLKAIFDIFRGQHRRMSLGDWVSCVRETGLLMPEVTLEWEQAQGLGRREACLCFLWARTLCSDEIRSSEKMRSITFVDFLEALARVAEVICPPTDEELKAWGGKSKEGLYYYYYRMEKLAGGPMGRATNRGIKRRPSAVMGAPKTRPLEQKLTQILGVIRKSLMSELNTRDERTLIRLLSEGSASTRRSIRR